MKEKTNIPKGVRGTFTDNSGRRHFVRASDERELGAKIAALKDKLNKGLIVFGDSTKVSVWAMEWLETYKEPTVGVTWYANLKIYLKQINAEIGSMPIGSVRSVHIQKLLNSKAHLSLSSVKKYRDVLNDMFQTAMNNGMIAINPVQATQIPKCKPNNQRRAITDEERTALLTCADKHKHGLFVLLILYCGLRPAEVAALDWKNVDLAKRTITVTRSLKRDGTIGDPKSKAGYRTVPIPAKLMPYLHKGIGLVCKRDSGQHHTSTTISHLWESLRRDMDVFLGAKLYRNQIYQSKLASDLTMYCLRHTYCTDLQSAGVPINIARELMGHADISTTSKIYTHFSEESFNNAAKMIDSFNDRVPKGVPHSL